MDQIKKIANEQEERLTGSNLYARCREVMGTCVAMRVKIEGYAPKEALERMTKGNPANILAELSRIVGEGDPADHRGEENARKYSERHTTSNGKCPRT